MKVLARGLLIASCGLLGACAGNSETVEPARNNDAQVLIDRYFKCVRDSAASQMVAQARMVRDGNAIAEVAFQSCATEEGTIRTYMDGMGIGTHANLVIMKHRTTLKQEIVAANPSPIRR